MAEEKSEVKEVKPVKVEPVVYPAWFQELVDGTHVVTEQGEPEAVSRMRNV
jgi:hypothetical protein